MIFDLTVSSPWVKIDFTAFMFTSLPTVQRDHLQNLARQAARRPELEINDFSIDRLAGGTGEGSQGIFCVSGNGNDQGETAAWSLILKILVPPGDLSARAVHFTDGFAYWKREAEALTSGLLEHLTPGLSAPICYEVADQPDGSVWLWMEEVEKVQTAWTVSRFAEVARRLGKWQGQYLVGKPLPQGVWLTPSGWNRDFVEENSATMELLKHSLEKPWVRYAYPEDKLKEILWVWEEREVFYQALENLPQVFCHRDVFGRNLLDRQGEAVLIDWAYAGIGAVGEELTPLVQATYLWKEVEEGSFKELEDGIFSGYLEGLGEVGWQGDAALVRLGYTASSALRYTIGNIRFGFQRLLDESISPDSADELSKGTRAMYDFWTETMRRHIFPLAHEAYQQAKE
jgi:hypothetical protein